MLAQRDLVNEPIHDLEKEPGRPDAFERLIDVFRHRGVENALRVAQSVEERTAKFELAGALWQVFPETGFVLVEVDEQLV